MKVIISSHCALIPKSDSLQWWDNLWLNESFATWCGEFVILSRLHPEWNLYSKFLLDHLASALNLDSLPSSHPVEQPCPTTEMIDEIFDDLSYSSL